MCRTFSTLWVKNASCWFASTKTPKSWRRTWTEGSVWFMRLCPVTSAKSVSQTTSTSSKWSLRSSSSSVSWRIRSNWAKSSSNVWRTVCRWTRDCCTDLWTGPREVNSLLLGTRLKQKCFISACVHRIDLWPSTQNHSYISSALLID